MEGSEDPRGDTRRAIWASGHADAKSETEIRLWAAP
jgi:hypothetical protein